MAEANRTFWEKAGYASDYNAEWKEKVLKYIQKEMRRAGIPIGPTILDLGSGVRPVSRFLASADSQVLTVDFNQPEKEFVRGSHTHIQRDLTELVDETSFAARRSVVEAAQALGLDSRADPKEQVDTIVLSDVLNYVPANEVLDRAVSYLKPGGTVIIFNQPGRTFDFAEHSLHPEGARDTNELQRYLEETLQLECVYESRTNEDYFIGVYQKADVQTSE